uniref:Amiloride-sensitive sodium channel subunit beta n=1 Tax=Anisakis simplex TaxID=6269 RepID=A0A346RVM5_ANISI|nr:Amiloride-sensitive sodium channel subunit beta [Anisakis simplex]
MLEERVMRKWAFWFIVAFLSALTMKDVIELILEYAANPKQSDMNMMFNESMTMPNITFCMSKTQAWSHFHINTSESTDQWDQIVQDNLLNMTDHDSFLKDPWDFRLVMEAYEVIATLNSMERETTANGCARSINVFRTQARLADKRKMIKMWLDAISDRDVTFGEFTEKVGQETIRRSMQRFQRTTFNEDLVIRTRFRTSWISMMQFCFQPWFDEDNFQSIEDQGNFFTMMLAHDVENLNGVDVECMSVDFHGRPSSLARFMQAKGRARDGYNDDLCAGLRHEVTVEVKAKYEMLENDDNGTACRDVEEGSDTEFDCRSRCRMKFIQQLCKCTGLTLSYLAKEDEKELQKYPLCDYEKCDIDVENIHITDEQCSKKCFRDCTQIRYEVFHEAQGKMLQENLTLVNLNWGSFEYLTLKQDWVWSVTTFIAALGGSIGMWLGLSILSLIQGGTYLYIYLTKEVIRKRVIAQQVAPGERKRSLVNSTKFAVNPLASPFGNKSDVKKRRISLPSEVPMNVTYNNNP